MNSSKKPIPIWSAGSEAGQILLLTEVIVTRIPVDTVVTIVDVWVSIVLHQVEAVIVTVFVAQAPVTSSLPVL